MNFIPLLQVSGGNFLMPVTLGLVFFIFYFFMIRPQKKEQKKTEAMIAALKKGDKVVTIGGIHGTVTSAKEKTVVIKVDDNCKIEMKRSAIATVVQSGKSSGKSSKVEKIEEKAEEDSAKEDSAPVDFAKSGDKTE